MCYVSFSSPSIWRTEYHGCHLLTSLVCFRGCKVARNCTRLAYRVSDCLHGSRLLWLIAFAVFFQLFASYLLHGYVGRIAQSVVVPFTYIEWLTAKWRPRPSDQRAASLPCNRTKILRSRSLGVHARYLSKGNTVSNVPAHYGYTQFIRLSSVSTAFPAKPDIFLTQLTFHLSAQLVTRISP